MGTSRSGIAVDETAVDETAAPDGRAADPDGTVVLKIAAAERTTDGGPIPTKGSRSTPGDPR